MYETRRVRRGDTVRIAKGLAEIRRRRWWQALAILGLLPAAAFAVRCSPASDSGAGFPWLIVAYFGVLVFTSMRVTYARCPRCNRYFHQHPFGRHPWTTECLHCGLSIVEA
jgi:hypothetical protein